MDYRICQKLRIDLKNMYGEISTRNKRLLEADARTQYFGEQYTKSYDSLWEKAKRAGANTVLSQKPPFIPAKVLRTALQSLAADFPVLTQAVMLVFRDLDRWQEAVLAQRDRQRELEEAERKKENIESKMKEFGC